MVHAIYMCININMFINAPYTCIYFTIFYLQFFYMISFISFFSVGLEDPDDLVKDLDQALEQVK